MPYSPQVLDHFHHPRCVGAIARATAVSEASNPVCGDILKLWASVSGGVITKSGFKAEGCVPAVACGSWLAEWIEGKKVSALALLTASEIEAGLGGLPEVSKHAAALAESAIHKLLVGLE
ncbi:MAG: iron-sulfur cluster assembly scaffold protein [Acidobacteriota bacterium]|nr:iron-sulfur cluster assembly scaffold protein [Acidobacteriota bacterium]